MNVHHKWVRYIGLLFLGLLGLGSILATGGGGGGGYSGEGGGGQAGVTVTLNAAGNVADVTKGTKQYQIDVSSHATAKLDADSINVLGTAAVNPTNLPSGYTFPDELLAFKVTGLNPAGGETITVTLTFSTTFDAAARYFKVANAFAVYPLAVFNGKTVTLTLTDNGTGDSDTVAGQITDPGGPAQPSTGIYTDRSQLVFGAKDGLDYAAGHYVMVNTTSGNYSTRWEAICNGPFQAWPTTGQGRGWVIVTPKPGDAAVGTNSGTLTIQPEGSGSPQSIGLTLNKYASGTTAKPFGSFDTPVCGSTVSGSVPVTGWVLDDVGVDSVRIYRQSGSTNVYLGDANLSEGARPDVAAQYPSYPGNQQAGWGYMMLTNFLPNGGNGTYTIEAIATDAEGQQTSLGTKTITCDNAHAVKPFGAIDTPAQGGNATGSAYRNWGWALTPQPNSIPTNGSTIGVFVDGAKVGDATYNINRPDLAAQLPDYQNSANEAGWFNLDTTQYDNGIHTIEWRATDSGGNTSVIGNRYFRVANTGAPSNPVNLSQWHLDIGATDTGKMTNSQNVYVNTGAGPLGWTLDCPTGINCSPTSGTGRGTFVVYADPNQVPAGTTNYTGTIRDDNGYYPPQTFTVQTKKYASGSTHPPFGSFDTPVSGSTVRGSVPVTGWVLDDVGVENVKIYNSSTYVGDAAFVEGARPDLQYAYPGYAASQKAGWSYLLQTNLLPGGGNGTYTLEAIATDKEGQMNSLGTKTIACDNAHAVKPFGAIDTPAQGCVASGSNYQVAGWALTPQPNTIPPDGSTVGVYVDGVKVGNATYNQYRSDIATLFPGYENTNGAGAYFYLDTTAYDNGVHSIQWAASDSGSNSDGIGSRYFTIQNTN
ncbi:MAG: Ig-like domain repeat protein [Proteobacteria bacterium]|nr:Ig-like domain repeat protein [Pseudomonadota bacterium]